MEVLYWDNWSKVKNRYETSLITLKDLIKKKSYKEIWAERQPYERDMMDALKDWLNQNGKITGLEHQNEQYGVPILSNGFAVKMSLEQWDYFMSII